MSRGRTLPAQEGECGAVRVLFGIVCLAGLVLAGQTIVAGANGAWPTYQHDAARSGVDPDQGVVTGITPAWTTALDESIFAQPLVIGSTVYAATENNTVYALDASNNGAQLWQRHLSTPVPLNQLPCGNIDPYGITGTPVIDVPKQRPVHGRAADDAEHSPRALRAGHLGQRPRQRQVPLPDRRAELATSVNWPARRAEPRQQPRVRRLFGAIW